MTNKRGVIHDPNTGQGDSRVLQAPKMGEELEKEIAGLRAAETGKKVNPAPLSERVEQLLSNFESRWFRTYSPPPGDWMEKEFDCLILDVKQAFKSDKKITPAQPVDNVDAWLAEHLLNGAQIFWRDPAGVCRHVMDIVPGRGDWTPENDRGDGDEPGACALIQPEGHVAIDNTGVDDWVVAYPPEALAAERAKVAELEDAIEVLRQTTRGQSGIIGKQEAELDALKKLIERSDLEEVECGGIQIGTQTTSRAMYLKPKGEVARHEELTVLLRDLATAKREIVALKSDAMNALLFDKRISRDLSRAWEKAHGSRVVAIEARALIHGVDKLKRRIEALENRKLPRARVDDMYKGEQFCGGAVRAVTLGGCFIYSSVEHSHRQVCDYINAAMDEWESEAGDE